MLYTRLSIAAFALCLGASGCAAQAPFEQPATPAPQGRSVALTAPSIAGSSDVTPALKASPAPKVDSEAIAIPNSEMVHGRATVVVPAPIEKVRDAVLGFAQYPEFMPHYEKCKLLGRTPAGARQLYMEIEALHGAVHMWAEVEMPKAQLADGVETYETFFVKGNVDDFKAIWRLKKLDPAQTELSLEVFLKPGIRLPVQLVNSENVKGAVKGVVAMRARALGETLPEED